MRQLNFMLIQTVIVGFCLLQFMLLAIDESVQIYERVRSLLSTTKNLALISTSSAKDVAQYES